MEMCRNRSVKGRELNIFVLKQSLRYTSEGWTLSWVPLLLAFLEFLTLVLEVWKILPAANTAPLVCLCRAGWHIGCMLGGQRAGESLPGCLLPVCSGQHCESSPDLKWNLGKFMLTLGFTSGNAEGQSWFLALRSFSSSAKRQHTSQAGTLLSRHPGHSSNWLSENGMGLQVQPRRWNFPASLLEKSRAV